MILPIWFTLVSTTGPLSSPAHMPAFSATVAAEPVTVKSKTQALRKNRRKKR